MAEESKILMAEESKILVAAESTPVTTATGAVVRNVAQVLVQMFAKEEETIKDLTAAEEQMRGITFDLLKEKLLCQVMKGIKLADLEKVIGSFARSSQMPDDVKDAILRGQYADENYANIIDFKFAIGEVGNFTYGRIVTIKRSRDGRDIIDLAYSSYQISFKLSPKVIEHKKKKKFLGFTTGKKVWRERFERNLSEKEQDYMRIYFLNKAITGFRKECSSFLED